MSSTREILRKHGVYSAQLELDLLRHIERTIREVQQTENNHDNILQSNGEAMSVPGPVREYQQSAADDPTA